MYNFKKPCTLQSMMHEDANKYIYLIELYTVGKCKVIDISVNLWDLTLVVLKMIWVVWKDSLALNA